MCASLFAGLGFALLGVRQADLLPPIRYRRMLGDAKFGWKWPVVDTLDGTRLIPFSFFLSFFLSYCSVTESMDALSSSKFFL
jgi:hypothetical protein